MAEKEHQKGLWFVGQRCFPWNASYRSMDAYFSLFAALRIQPDAYFAEDLRLFDLPLAPDGTPFQLSVWVLLTGIPYGETRT